jgi:hypothetical protein
VKAALSGDGSITLAATHSLKASLGSDRQIRTADETKAFVVAAVPS